MGNALFQGCFRFRVASVFLALVAFSACSRDSEAPPSTHPVTGKVTFKGRQTFAGGTIEFVGRKDEPSATADIAADGSFTLYTLTRSGRKLEGAAAGSFQVTVHPPMDEAQKAEAVALPKPYVVEARANHFAIEIP